MKFLKSFLPNFTIVLAAAMVILLYLDNRNPMMGFLYGPPFAIYGIIFAVSSISVSVMYYISARRDSNGRKESKQDNFTKASNAEENETLRGY